MFVLPSLSQDVIYKKDQIEIKCKVLELTPETIKFRNFDQPSGPVRNISNNDVFMIIYEDGTKEMIKGENKEEAIPEPAYSNADYKRKEPALPLILRKKYVRASDLRFLKGQSEVNIEFDYSSMQVGEFTNEQDYINKRVNELNAKTPGRGDQWADAWIGDRKAKYEPEFIEILNRYVARKKTGLIFTVNAANAKYTLVINTTFTEPGFEAGVVYRWAYLHLQAIFYESNSPDVAVGFVGINQPPTTGHTGVIHNYGGITLAYKTCGDALGRWIFKLGYK